MLMTGSEYLESIRDGRALYVGRERIADQTRHPAFAGGARTYAALYDMKADPALRDVMTFADEAAAIVCITCSRARRKICGAATGRIAKSQNSASD
jgi:aromatic ring hydroxylase